MLGGGRRLTHKIGATLVGVSLLLGAPMMSRSDSDYQGYPLSRNADIGTGAAGAVLFAGSAWYGFASAGLCRYVKKRAAAEEADGDD